MSRQSTRTFISPANADTSPESRCMAYLERKFNPDNKTESSHTLESAKKAVAFGLKTGLIRRTAQAHDYRDEIRETTRKIVALRHSVGWTQAFVDKQFGYKGKRTSRFEAGYQSYAATKRFLEHLERLVAYEMKHAKKRKQIEGKQQITQP